MPQECCQLYLIRHGQTAWNELGKVQGQGSDTPLNDRGKSQAHEMRLKLQDVAFDGAYCSDSQRARETASIILSNRTLSIHETHLLREGDVGSWEGSPVEEFLDWLHQHNAKLSPYELEKWQARYHPEVENFYEMYQRIRLFVEPLPSRHPGKNILVCLHGGIMISIMQHLQFKRGQRWHVANGAMLILQVRPGSFEILSLDGIHPIEPSGS